jgi:hypothetical protein
VRCGALLLLIGASLGNGRLPLPAVLVAGGLCAAGAIALQHTASQVILTVSAAACAAAGVLALLHRGLRRSD